MPKSNFLKKTLVLLCGLLTIGFQVNSARANQCSKILGPASTGYTKHIGVLIKDIKTGEKHARFDAIVGSSHEKLVRALIEGNTSIQKHGLKVLWLGEVEMHKPESIESPPKIKSITEASGLAKKLKNPEEETAYPFDLDIAHAVEYFGSIGAEFAKDFTAVPFNPDGNKNHLIPFLGAEKFRHDIINSIGVIIGLVNLPSILGKDINVLSSSPTEENVVVRKDFEANVKKVQIYIDIIKKEIFSYLTEESQNIINQTYTDLTNILDAKEDSKPGWSDLNALLRTETPDILKGLQLLQSISLAEHYLDSAFSF